ncbi:MAG: hypothetical protein RJA59_2072 [Pseudomonadota bacterium]
MTFGEFWNCLTNAARNSGIVEFWRATVRNSSVPEFSILELPYGIGGALLLGRGPNPRIPYFPFRGSILELWNWAGGRP